MCVALELLQWLDSKAQGATSFPSLMAIYQTFYSNISVLIFGYEIGLKAILGMVFLVLCIGLSFLMIQKSYLRDPGLNSDKGILTVVYDLGVSKHFGSKQSYTKNWQNSQRFWYSNILIYWYFDISDIPSIYIVYENNQDILD